MQQEASRRLGFTATRTMRAAQTLYEGVEIAGQGTMGLITYMRTDSLRIADEAVAAAKEYISGAWGDAYVCKTKRTYKSRSATAAQDAHEAVRPTNVALTPDEVGLYTRIIQEPVSAANGAKALADYIHKIESESHPPDVNDLRAVAEKMKQTKGYGG